MTGQLEAAQSSPLSIHSIAESPVLDAACYKVRKVMAALFETQLQRCEIRIMTMTIILY
jgi:hypothetical protein